MLTATVEATPSILEVPSISAEINLNHAVAAEVRKGLTATPRMLSPWLFYDELGSHLFEQITALPEYYLTRTERALFEKNAIGILKCAAGDRKLTLLELGAGTAAKTGILLAAAVQQQGSVLYQPLDVSTTALEVARETIERTIPNVTVRPQIVNYITEPFTLHRPEHFRILALYIGSSIGNFAPGEAASLLRNLRAQLQPGDALLLGVDLVPGPEKPIATLLAAYDDAAGITAAFNRNLLARLNRDLGANFHPEDFQHKAIWNATASRIEMHLVALTPQMVHIPANSAGPALMLHFAAGETIHTENSYKFTSAAVDDLLEAAGFTAVHSLHDERHWFAVTLATAV